MPSLTRTVRAILIAAGLMWLATTQTAAAVENGPGRDQDTRPNVILILVDDLGVGDLSVTGNRLISTPNIDAIAANGANFSTAYNSSPVCTTSRAGLLTGRYQQRFGLEHNPMHPNFAGAISGDPRYAGERSGALRDVPEDELVAPERQGLPHTEVTLAERLRSLGYRTAIVGKWHLGSAPRLRPDRQGFEEHYGFYGGASLFAEHDDPDVVNARLTWSGADNFLWDRLPFTLVRDGELVAERGYMTDLFADEAIRYVDASSPDQPFFLYLAFNAPHNPLQAPRQIYEELDHIEGHHRRVYFAMVVALDRAIGRVMQAMHDRGIDRNTIVIFASDNGGADYARVIDSNEPYRGWKASFWEGGIRTPLFISWPDRIEPGSYTDRPASLLDIVPTILAANGVNDISHEDLDGIDLLSLLDPDVSAAPRDLFWRNEGNWAVRSGDWKMIVSEDPARTWLYNLADDPTEQHDLARVRPGIVEELNRRIARQNRLFAGRPLWPSLMQIPVFADWPSGQGNEETDDYINWPG